MKFACHEKTGAETLGDVEIYKEYYIEKCGEKLTIDVSDIIEKQGVSINDISVMLEDIVDGTGAEKIKIKKDKLVSTVTIKTNLDYTHEYNVYVVNDNGLTLKKAIPENSTVVGHAKRVKTLHYLVYGCPIIDWWGIGNSIVLIEDTGDEYVNSYAQETITKKLQTDFKFENPEFTYVSEKKLQIQYESFENFLTQFKIEDVDLPIEDVIDKATSYYLYYYGTVDYTLEDNIYLLEENSDDDENQSAIMGFDLFVDTLPFYNYAWDFTNEGNCAGIAYYTSLLYNTKSAPAVGQYTSDLFGGETVSWDLSTDSENDTLTNPGLFDYKDVDFVKANESGRLVLGSSNTTEGEFEFVKMIGCYWAQYNDVRNEDYYEYPSGTSCSYQLIEDMIDYLNQDKILTLSFSYYDTSSAKTCYHAVNIYGYYYDEYDPSVIFFEVYDSNYGQNNRPYINYTNEGKCLLKVQKEEDNQFEFIYNPTEYLRAETDAKQLEYYEFMIMDEEWNVWNGRY